MFKFLRKPPKRAANITVYYLSAITDGIPYASPIGIMPRFSDEYEQELNVKHQPKPEFGACTYITEELDNNSVILCWQFGVIDAINFLSEREARQFPGFVPFPNEDLLMLDKALKHFPRSQDSEL